MDSRAQPTRVHTGHSITENHRISQMNIVVFKKNVMVPKIPLHRSFKLSERRQLWQSPSHCLLDDELWGFCFPRLKGAFFRFKILNKYFYGTYHASWTLFWHLLNTSFFALIMILLSSHFTDEAVTNIQSTWLGEWKSPGEPSAQHLFLASGCSASSLSPGTHVLWVLTHNSISRLSGLMLKQGNSTAQLKLTF